MRKFIFVLAFLFVAVPAKANDIYIAQNASGAGNGADCSDAVSYTFFNTGGNWGSGANLIGPGTTVHLCGTITAAAGASGFLTFQGNGTSGNPITFLFESGASLQSPYWGSGGAIAAKDRSYVVVDLGTNGTLYSTANGTTLANQQNGALIVMDGSSNSEVKCDSSNCLLGPEYNHTYDLSDENAGSTYDIHWAGGSNVKIDNVTYTGAHWCIYYTYPENTTTSNVSIFNNTGYNCDHTVAFGDGDTNSILAGTNLIYGNTLHDAVDWDDAQDNNHHDGIHVWAVHSGSTITNMQIYNNYIYGDWGCQAGGNCGNGSGTESGASGYIYVEAISGGSITGTLIYNNLLVNNATSTNHSPADAYIFDDATGSSVLNNTVVGESNSESANCIAEYQSGGIYENNICANSRTAIYVEGSVAVANNNDYSGLSANTTFFDGSWYHGLSAWQSGTGLDSQSSAGNADLSSNYHLSAGSAAIGLGGNLTSLNITALDSDQSGAPRSSSGAWDAGAFVYSGSQASQPNPPTNLTATVN